MGNQDKVSDLLDRLFKQMQTRTYSQCKLQLLNCIYTIVKAFRNWTPLKDFEGIQGHLDKMNTLTEVRQWLEQEISLIMNNLFSRKRGNRKDELLQDIVEYINNHLHDPLLSANDIAEHISMSESYVRQLFKDVFSSTISDYILKEKIDMVKKMLVKTDLPVSDISQRSGFITKSHFFTTFKKETGMTPMQFREEFKKKP
jgi:AraC-like DNA-binding protein